MDLIGHTNKLLNMLEAANPYHGMLARAAFSPEQMEGHYGLEGDPLEDDGHAFWATEDMASELEDLEEACIGLGEFELLFFKPEEEIEKPEVDNNEYAACPECGMECVVIFGTGRFAKAKIKCVDCGTQTLTDY